MLELPMQFMGHASVIHPTLVWDDEHVVLIDAGMPQQLMAIKGAMATAGVDFERLDKVILTHQDIDHIGGMPDLLGEAGQRVEVLAHAIDKPYIEGEKPPIKMNPERIQAMLASLPEEQRARVQAMFATPIKSRVDRTLADGETLPWCGGITVLFTPGHTPGHISLYLHQSKVLVTGDAMVVVDGALQGPSQANTPDMEQATASLRKFGNLDVSTVICYHGGAYSNNASDRLAALAGQA